MITDESSRKIDNWIETTSIWGGDEKFLELDRNDGCNFQIICDVCNRHMLKWLRLCYINCTLMKKNHSNTVPVWNILYDMPRRVHIPLKKNNTRSARKFEGILQD